MRHQYLASFIFVSFLLLGSQKVSRASEGDPLAIRKWPDGAISLETHWGLHIVVDPNGNASKHLSRKADRAVSPSEDIDHYLTRRSNTSNVSWLPAAELNQKDPNAIHVKSFLQLGNEKSILLEVDGVRIIFVPTEWFRALSNRDSIDIDLRNIENADLLILATSNPAHLATACSVSLINAIHPKVLMLNQLDVAQRSKFEQFREDIEADHVVTQIDHNTLVLSRTIKDRSTQVVLLTDTPWNMPEELSGLFKAMKKANQDSQAVFAKLSTNQMNFRPANGTHTPRWNTEHMMGRQLLFFSQIYHEQNPSIPVMDLNPKQMPPDYVFAHPDWDGREEARQMQRVSDFTRRFAYLLADVDLDKKAPGSGWTLRALLKQMQRHYSGHTANTIKKFDLPGWPKE